MKKDMKLLVIGSGAREHALCHKLAESEYVKEIFAAPGNGGTATLAKTSNAQMDIMDFAAVTTFCQKQNIDFVVVGPDNPLAEGIVDYLQEKKIKVFGPNKKAAQLESSKIFSKDFMSRNLLPTARWLSATSYTEAESMVKEHPWIRVIKADGLALGKGVFVCDNENDALSALDEIFNKQAFGAAGAKVVLEEKLQGEELSLLLFVDGKTVKAMPPCQDYKRRFDDDKGPNTGGMGVYSPVAIYDKCRQEIEKQVLAPLKAALTKDAIDYKGVLYVGLMIAAKEIGAQETIYQPYVLEFNARFGDPETQVILPLMKSDLLPVLYAVSEGKLDQVEIAWLAAAACAVVLAADTYPASSSSGKAITITDLPDKSYAFHAGTKNVAGQLQTNGGRIITLTAVAKTLAAARENAYKSISAIKFEGMSYRQDIGRRATECLSR